MDRPIHDVQKCPFFKMHKGFSIFFKMVQCLISKFRMLYMYVGTYVPDTNTHPAVVPVQELWWKTLVFHISQMMESNALTTTSAHLKAILCGLILSNASALLVKGTVSTD